MQERLPSSDGQVRSCRSRHRRRFHDDLGLEVGGIDFGPLGNTRLGIRLSDT